MRKYILRIEEVEIDKDEEERDAQLEARKNHFVRDMNKIIEYMALLGYEYPDFKTVGNFLLRCYDKFDYIDDFDEEYEFEL